MMPTYKPAEFVPSKAKGSLVWDKQNKKYIDLTGLTFREYMEDSTGKFEPSMDDWNNHISYSRFILNGLVEWLI